MWIGREEVEPSNKCLVGSSRVCMSSRASIVQGREHPRGPFLFNQLTHDLVVKVLDGSPFDSFSFVFFLFGLQGQLNKDLLQFLVDVIDAELFEGVPLENLESVD